MYLFDRRTDNIIIRLKKASSKLKPDGSDEEEFQDNQDEESEDEEEESIKSPVPVASTEEKQEGSEEDDLTLGDEEEDLFSDGDEDLAADQMAFQSVDIDDGLMKEELFFLRNMVWDLKENVQNSYDFGLVFLDCFSFKDRAVKHVKALIEKLEHTVQSEFTSKQNTIQQEIIGVEGKLNMEAKSIDDVIMLLDYIETLNNQDTKIADIKVMIDQLSIRMDYIEQIEVMFPSEQYYEFLTIRNWPRTFKQYIQDRKQELLS